MCHYKVSLTLISLMEILYFNHSSSSVNKSNSFILDDGTKFLTDMCHSSAGNWLKISAGRATRRRNRDEKWLAYLGGKRIARECHRTEESKAYRQGFFCLASRGDAFSGWNLWQSTRSISRSRPGTGIS